ncbi:(5-formylfuran-3-yl)methyl phosphate synthase [Methylomonas methanica]|uniref:(5-formylfuran-3-yl)methyl phosphate synthase n=1 Tax=Methylomonas methanica (strain DSM 25384 / MC09) TaxID=857087 RepID=G0A6W1_METMM|nr:(5-formylfuran-3-yl)methyl phosphate synthase [Methylomonas methanica]AEG00582.1 protein of unknown function DUF556 [Methylomonas methanica MC09]
MSGMLASVNSLDEALLIQSFSVDIVDLKQPAQGALGALSVSEVAEIVANLSGRNVISATVGDLPMQPDLLFTAVQAMASTGVDYVKIGFFPGGDWQACIDSLATLARTYRLIAVLFADTGPDVGIINALRKAGFAGVMLDTMDKTLGSLTQLMTWSELAGFTDAAKAAGLLTGLAGSLTQHDIPALLSLQADYLGFRGALCRQHCRTAQLDADRIVWIRQLLLGAGQPNGAMGLQSRSAELNVLGG